jgi:hypothetical protein
MDDLINAINSIYYSVIDDIEINILSKQIVFELTLYENGNRTHHIMQFGNVTSILWLEKPQNSQAFSLPNCDYYELTSVTIQRIGAATCNSWLKQYLMEYNVAIEIWESALLINATEVSIDNQFYSIND